MHPRLRKILDPPITVFPSIHKKYIKINWPFHGFFNWDQLAKICQHDRRERPWISKVAKFESNFLKTNEDIAPQSRRIL